MTCNYVKSFYTITIILYHFIKGNVLQMCILYLIQCAYYTLLYIYIDREIKRKYNYTTVEIVAVEFLEEKGKLIMTT